jgi:hypothetical protein
MKKFIRSILLFIPFAALTYIVLLLLWGEFMPQKIYTNLVYTKGYSDTALRVEEAKKVKNPDVLFLGSSHASQGFDIRIFKQAGYSTFNLGSFSQSPLQTRILMERYLKQINPKLVVFEVYPGIFIPNNIEAATDLISNDCLDTMAVNMALGMKNISVYNTLAYSWYDNLKGSPPPDSIEMSPELTYVHGGYIETEMRYYSNRPVKKKRKWRLDEKQLKAFEMTLALLKKNKIPYVLLVAPIPKSSYEARLNNAEFDAYMKTKGSYYNYNGKIALNDSLHFLDNNHLNQRGVELFNNELLKNKAIFTK